MLEARNTRVATIPALATCVVVPLVAFSVMAAGSTWPVPTQWDSLLAMVVIAGASVALACLIGAAICLLVIDWLAEVRGRAAWAAVAAGHSIGGLDTEHQQADQIYRPAVHDETVQAVLRANRYAVPLITGEAETRRWHDQAEPMPLDHGTAVRCPNVEGARKAWTVVDSSAPVLRRTWSQRQFHNGARVVERPRCAVNARTGDAWWGAGSPRVAGIPIRTVSDIVVLGQDQNGSDDGKTLPGTQFNGAPPIRAGPTPGIARSTVRSRTRRHPDASGGFDLTVLAEARRQIVALAEALARQAAREDDAAEQRERHSDSAPGTPAEQSPTRDAKDDTS